MHFNLLTYLLWSDFALVETKTRKINYVRTLVTETCKNSRPTIVLPERLWADCLTMKEQHKRALNTNLIACINHYTAFASGSVC